MTPEEYAARQALISAAAARLVLSFGKFFLRPFLTPLEWLNFLRFLFPEVKRFRDESAALGRTFFDLERDKFHPEVPNNARLLEPYEFEWFVQNVEDSRKALSREDAQDSALERLALTVVREVENGGRKQIIHAVEDDEPLKRKFAEEAGRPAQPETRPVRGWARVATGRETCAWCLMLVSRGPVYLGADTAGLDLPDWEAQQMIAAGEDVREYMDEWHTGCDCKVVPVYDLKNWPGKDAAERAEKLWVDASRIARKTLEDNPGKLYYSQKERRWKPTTLNRETINELRRRLEGGEIDPSIWAAIQAA